MFTSAMRSKRLLLDITYVESFKCTSKFTITGLTAFDFIMDYDEWIDCGYFSDEIRARLKGERTYFDILQQL